VGHPVLGEECRVASGELLADRRLVQIHQRPVTIDMTGRERMGSTPRVRYLSRRYLELVDGHALVELELGELGACSRVGSQIPRGPRAAP
jgi:hypothetical protein